eukprot:1501909-Amphidinium_carterae.1
MIAFGGRRLVRRNRRAVSELASGHWSPSGVVALGLVTREACLRAEVRVRQACGQRRACGRLHAYGWLTVHGQGCLWLTGRACG